MTLMDQAALTSSSRLLCARFVSRPVCSKPHATEEPDSSSYLDQLILIAGQQQVTAIQPFALSDGAPHTVAVVWAHGAMVIDLAGAHKEDAYVRICAGICTNGLVRSSSGKHWPAMLANPRLHMSNSAVHIEAEAHHDSD